MNTMHPLAIIDTASITSLVRATLYHRSIHVHQTHVERSEGVAALGGREMNHVAHRAAAQSDDHEQPCVTDDTRSDSERKTLL
jgi:hypothetical protein